MNLSHLTLCAILAAFASGYAPTTTQRAPLREAVKDDIRLVAQAIGISQVRAASSPTTTLVPAQMAAPGPTRAPLLAYVSPPPGTWSTLPNTAIWPVLPPESKGCTAFNPGCGKPELWSPRAVFAYSGGDLATITGVLGFLYWGGGHADSPDNSLYFAPFDGSGPRRLSGPYLAPSTSDPYPYYPSDGLDYYTTPSRNQPGVLGGGAPKSRHTYSGIVAISVNGKPYFFTVGGGIASRGGHGTNATRLFDLSSTYAQAMARPDMGWLRKTDSPYSLTASAGWDPKTGLVVVRTRNTYSAYNPVADTWTKWADAGGGSDYEASVAMDVEGRKMYVLGGNIAEVVDLDKRVVTVLGVRGGSNNPEWLKGFVTPAPLGYLNGPGVAWHSGRKRLLVYYNTVAINGTQQDILQIDPVRGTVETLRMAGVTVTTTPGYAINGRWRLIPGTDTVVLAGAVDTDVFIGQLPASGTTAISPPTPGCRAATPASDLRMPAARTSPDLTTRIHASISPACGSRGVLMNSPG